MDSSLIQSDIDRQNILNNHFAIEEIKKRIWISLTTFDGKYVLTKKQVADFYLVDERTINRYLDKNDSELRKNWYELLTWERLNKAINEFDHDMNVTIKTRQLWLFDFRAFLNIWMLLQESEKAKYIRSLILDIVIDTVNQKAGWHTKLINQREEDYLLSSFSEENYRKEFTSALHNYVDLGPYKYRLYTNKVYQIAFRENAEEYKEILWLDKKENVRDTFYSEVLDVIAGLENGIANELKKKFQENDSIKLSSKQTDEVFNQVENNSFLKPVIDRARQLMWSRDLCFRDALHENIEEYIGTVSKADFEKFLWKKSKTLQERLKETEDVFKRLKDR